MLFVIVSHTLVFLPQDDADEASFFVDLCNAGIMLLQFVVMPAFSLACGYLSPKRLDRRRILNLARLATTFLIAQTFWSFLQAYLEDASVLPLVFWCQPGINWFMLCLVVWRACMPVLSMLRWPLCVSVLIGTGALCTDPYYFLKPVFTFLPFFVAGYRLQGQTEVLQFWRRPSVRIAFLSMWSVIWTLAIFMPELEDPIRQVGKCFYGSVPGKFMAATCPITGSHWYAPFVHVASYGFSVMLILGFLGFLPQRQVLGLTQAGMMSMYSYVLHFYVISITHLLLDWAHVKQTLTASSYLMDFAYSLFIWQLLAMTFWRVCFGFVVEPRVELCFAPEPEQEITEMTGQPPAQQAVSV